MTSTGAPTFILGASDSRTLAISHTVDRSPTVKTGSLAPVLMYWPRPTLRWMIVPPIGADTMVSAPMRSVFSSLAISSSERPRMRSRLRAAASAISAERMSPCAFTRSDCACSRSLSAPPLIASSSFCRFSTCLGELQPRLRLVDAGDGGDQVVLALHELARLDREQRRAALDMIAGPGDQLADAAGVGREDRRGGVVVDRDLAVGGALVAERDLAHGGEPQARPLRVARPESAVGVTRRLLGPRDRVALSAVEQPESGDQRRHGHDAAARQPQAVPPEVRASSRWI